MIVAPTDIALLVLFTAALSSVLTMVSLNLVDRPNDRLLDELNSVDKLPWDRDQVEQS